MLDELAHEALGPGPDEPAHPHRSRGREAAIRDAALELLVEVGYDQMSMDAVAARAHASKATIYRRWRGKCELVLDAVHSRTAEALELPDTGSLRGDILAMLHAAAEGFGAQDASLMAGVLVAMRSTPELADCVRTNIVEQKRYVARTLVERAVARGELPPEADPEVFHETAAALFFFRLLVTPGPVDEGYLCHITDDILVPLLATSRQSHLTQEKKQ